MPASERLKTRYDKFRAYGHFNESHATAAPEKAAV